MTKSNMPQSWRPLRQCRRCGTPVKGPSRNRTQICEQCRRKDVLERKKTGSKVK